MTEKQESYDFIVIGGGPAGYVAGIRAAQLGLKTVCIEERDTLGGTCLNVGCIPSKALLYSTEMLSWLQHQAKLHGIDVEDPQVNFKQMMQRKDVVVEQLTASLPHLFQKVGLKWIQGRGRLVSAHEVEIQDSKSSKATPYKIRGSSILLASGSQPIELPFAPFDEQMILSSTGVLSLSKVPKSMLIIGAGVIGVELASVYQRLGSQVTMVEMLDHICGSLDGELAKGLLHDLRKQGVEFYLESKVTQVTKGKGKVVVEFQDKQGKQEKLTVEKLLVAVGRRPVTQNMGLEELGIKLDKGFVVVDGNFRTTVGNIYAVGDIISGPMLAHRASEEAFAVAEVVANRCEVLDYMALPNVIYTHPEVASVGITEEEAKGTGLVVCKGKSSFRGNPRARCHGDMDGFVKVIGLGEKRYLAGMHIIGAHASEMIQIGMVAIAKRMTLDELARLPFAHPTLSEAIKEACDQAVGCAIH